MTIRPRRPPLPQAAPNNPGASRFAPVAGWRLFVKFGPPGLALLALFSCEVGRGSGRASGTLFVADCNRICRACEQTHDFGTRASPASFDLRPTFFAGEPIEDIGIGRKDNRLIIRLLRTGKQIELNDLVAFDVVQAAEVARCVRGRMLTGVRGALVPDYDTKTCFWGPNGPRIRVGVDQPIHATLVPRATCERTVVASAFSTEAADGQWESWIEFAAFGSAVQEGLSPTARTPVDVEFKVDFGERLWARAFKVALQDDRLLKTIKRMEPPQPSEIFGTLEGSFDFDLLRGQGAQPFP